MDNEKIESESQSGRGTASQISANLDSSGKVEDNRFARVGGLLLSRSVIASPSDVIGRDVEAVPRVRK